MIWYAWLGVSLMALGLLCGYRAVVALIREELQRRADARRVLVLHFSRYTIIIGDRPPLHFVTSMLRRERPKEDAL